MGKKTKTLQEPIEIQIEHSEPTSSSNLVTDIQAFIHDIFSFANSFLISMAYFMLFFQTILILSEKDSKYINLRHITLKWLVFLILQEIKIGFISSKTINSQVAVILIDLLIIFAAYPSRVLKLVHLKYFSHKDNQRYQESVGDPNAYDVTFSNRVLTSFSVGLLNMAKHVIAFIPPANRRPIEESLKNVNAVVIDRKCFWSIYEDKKDEDQMFPPKDKNSLKEFLLSGSHSHTQAGAFDRSLDQQQKKQTQAIIKVTAQKCSSHSLKAMKKVAITYNALTSDLELLDLDFGKIEQFILEEISVKDQANHMLELKAVKIGDKFQQSIYIKFKNSRELQSFMRSIEEAEKML